MINMLKHMIDDFRVKITPPRDASDSPAIEEMRQASKKLDEIIETRYGRDVLRDMVLNRETPHNVPTERR